MGGTGGPYDTVPEVTFLDAFLRGVGHGSRIGTWLLERGQTPRFAHLGTVQECCDGHWEQHPHQDLRFGEYEPCQ